MDGWNGIAYRNPPPVPPVVRTTGVRPGTTTAPSVVAAESTSRIFNYTLRGTRGTIVLALSPGISTSQRSLPRLYTCVRYNNDKTPCTDDEIRQHNLKYLDEQAQKSTLDNLVRSIRSRAADPDDQARIAISLVQNIPYDYDRFYANRSGETRYPYQVLADNAGICSEKSRLMAYLLRELGYGVVLFSFETEQHMAVGIKSPAPYSFRDSGYAFIESTAPSIPTDSQGDYTGTGKLTSTPDIIRISDGRSFGSIAEEYADATAFNQFGDGGTLSPERYRAWEILMWKYGLSTRDGTTITDDPREKPLCGDGIYCNGRCWTGCHGSAWRCTGEGLVCYS
jgi:hypothetical protein